DGDSAEGPRTLRFRGRGAGGRRLHAAEPVAGDGPRRPARARTGGAPRPRQAGPSSLRAGDAPPRQPLHDADASAGVNAMAFALHLLPDMRLGEGALLAGLIVVVLVLGSRVYGGVRHLWGVDERLLIVGTSPLARLVVEEIARRPRRYAL